MRTRLPPVLKLLSLHVLVDWHIGSSNVSGLPAQCPSWTAHKVPDLNPIVSVVMLFCCLLLLFFVHKFHDFTAGASWLHVEAAMAEAEVLLSHSNKAAAPHNALVILEVTLLLACTCLTI